MVFVNFEVIHVISIDDVALEQRWQNFKHHATTTLLLIELSS